MEKEYFTGKMVENLLELGKMVNNQGLEYIIQTKHHIVLVSGLMVRGVDGQKNKKFKNLKIMDLLKILKINEQKLLITLITHLYLFNKVYMSILCLSVGSKINSFYYLFLFAAFKGLPAKVSSSHNKSETGLG